MTTTTNPDDSPDDGAEAVSREEAEELIDEIERRRSLQGVAAIAVGVIGILFSIFQLFLAARSFTFTIPLPTVDLGVVSIQPIDISLQLLQANAIHVAFALVITFLLFPGSTGDGFVARYLGWIAETVSQQFDERSPVTQVVDRLRGVFRWLFVDRDMERVTPFDLVCIWGR